MEKVEQILLQQNKNADAIRKFMTNTNKTGRDNQTRGFLQGRLNLLEKYWSKFETTHDDIILIPNDSEHTAFYQDQDVYNEIETIYSNTLGVLNDTLFNLDARRQPVAPGAVPEGHVIVDRNQHLKLPAIALPKFSGDFSQWTSFHDLFDSLVVKNTSLSNVNKLHHLKSSLYGEAELVLRQFAIEENNFVPAWALLRRRYANKRMLVNAQFSKLLSQPRVLNSRPEAIRNMLDTSTECITALKAQLTEAERFDSLAVYILTQKLDVKTTEAWEQSIINQDNFQTFDAFTTFLENHCRTQELVRSTTLKAADNHGQDHHRTTTKAYHVSKSTIKCVLCQKDNHSLFRCFRFKKMSAQERVNFTKSKKLCVRCLSAEHNFDACPHSYQCFKCKEPHNFLLHKSENNTTNTNAIIAGPSSSLTTPNTNSKQQDSTFDATVYTHFGNNLGRHPVPQTLLATAQIHVTSSDGKVYRLRALIDPGSQSSLITRSAASLLNLQLIKCRTTVKGLGATAAGESSHIVNCIVGSIHDANMAVTIKAIVMPKLTDLLPSNHIEMLPSWTHIQNIQLADPMFFKPEKIDMLLGADAYGEIIIPEIRKGPVGAPIAQRSIFGWILIGNIFNDCVRPTSSREVVSHFTEAIVCDQLRKFWELEEVSEARKPSKEDELIENHYRKTHVRKPDGRYSVDLPFNTVGNVPPVFGNTRNQAVMRLNQVERRLRGNPILKSQYVQFINEYLSLGHMHIVKEPSTNTPFYLPHHAIVKPSSTSTKLRVVFDASAKDYNNKSLNDTFHIGPTIQQDLLTILLRWRKHKIAITADVEKMYRQIGINDHHHQFQRILWRNQDGIIEDYELSTVTYGTACAPYLAIRTIHQMAQDEQSRFPVASERALKDMYVDDLISGCDSVTEAQELQRNMAMMFQTGGFNLRKWSSNVPEVLDNIPSANREGSICLDVCREDIIKTLGIMWHTIDDKFRFVVHDTDKPLKLTKRTLLSDVARLFDPIGFLAPVVINAKIMFQSLWLKGLAWDDNLPEDVVAEWSKLRSNLNEVSTIEIPRWIGTSHSKKTQFHGFCDASIKAYAAVVYCRTEEAGHVKVHILTAKTRVAPIKRVSLPNLELCGATLLATLIKKVQESMEIDAQIFAWTDSTIVLDWIKNNTHKQIFVANRVSTILSILKPAQWRHVRSKENPADMASRGICPSQLQANSLWWNGPLWLQESITEWPTFYQHKDSPTTMVAAVQSSTISKSDQFLKEVFEKFSSFDLLLRVIARCLQFARKCSPNNKDTNSGILLTSDDLREAKYKLIKAIQMQHYSNERTLLSKSEPLGTSKIASLYPFCCNQGLLRVGGRLRNADINFNHMHPILLPREHQFTKLLIHKIHKETLHGGLKIMLATLRQNYWVSNARTLIRATIHKCVRCRRYSTTCHEQLMSALPKVRVQPSKVFAHVGVDYAGPFDLRLSKHRGRGTFKGFVAIFVCLSTKAIHLELASDLSSKTFIAAFKRFVARRGLCTDVYSDNGSNFIGANREMQSKFDETMQQIQMSVSQWVVIKGVKWHFIPASSPHFGGLWEAGVKSFKHHLRRISDNTTLTYEEFQTLIIEIEAVLNSRPLCPLSSDTNDTDALTPGHFLTGAPLNAVPEPSVLHIHENRLERWQYVEKLNQDFWKSWTRDYLSELQQRPKKWRNERPNLKEGDIVIIKDIRLPPMNWPLARITATHPGDDGIVRAVTVKHKNGETKRAISKICRLPVREGQF